MKKIGILTFHNVPNYGAILQAYALKKYLEVNTDKCVVVLDFQCLGNSDEFEPKNIQRNIVSGKGSILKKIIKLLHYLLFVNNKEYSNKIKEFSDFRNNYLNIDRDLEALKTKYDLVVCGSDQIWNPNITGGFQDYYFGKSQNQQGIRTISYAASCGNVEEITMANEEEFLRKIDGISQVGVREKSLYDYLIDKGLKVYYNVDPTFLLNRNDYINDFSLTPNEKKYILVYALQRNPLLNSVAEIISRKMNLPVKAVSGYIPKKKKEKGERFDVGPIEFLNLIYNAEYIVTNSFHGLAFALIFKKNFNIIMPKSRANRLSDLLYELDLTRKICTSNDIDTSDINYCYVEKKLDDRINESKRYLLNELGRE